jgi:hypothetical protein
MGHLKNILRVWLPLVIAVTGISGLVYLTSQQVLRMGANDPQIAMAQDNAAALASGSSAGDLLSARPVDIAVSLSPFLVIYDSEGQPVAGTGTLHGQLPELPPGIFQYVDQKGEDRVTWQPEPGIRIAAVVVGIQGDQPGFVMAGRSLKESESRTDQIGKLVGAAWVAILLASLVVVILVELIFDYKPS